MRRSVVVFISVVLGACATDSGGAPLGPATGSLCTGGQSYAYLVNALDVPRANVGVVDGFNLDGAATVAGDPTTGCGQADFVSPAGEIGIDNQFAVIADAMVSEFDMSAELTEAVNTGSLTLVVEVQNVDSSTEDGCVNVVVSLGTPPNGGQPLVGSDGRPAAGQTFRTQRLGSIRGTLSGGQVVTEAIDFQSQVTLTDPPAPITIHNARLRFTLSASGLFGGVMGGAIPVSMLQSAVTASDPTLGGAAQLVLSSNADMTVTSLCDALSAGFVFSAVPASVAP